MPILEESTNSYTVGVIADTHGLLRPDVMRIFSGMDLIIHAGDIGSREILSSLAGAAEIIAVRGNMDHGEWTQGLSLKRVVYIGGLQLYVLHDLNKLAMDPVASGFSAVIFGHSHRPCMQEKEGVLYLNPGSAGPCRFNIPASIALLEISNGKIDARFINLKTDG